MEKGKLEKKNKDNLDNNSLVKTLIIGLIGLILLLIPGTLNKIIGILVGAALLAVGGYSIYNYVEKKNDNSLNLASGILYAVLGLIIILYPHSVLNLVAKCLGVYLIINGVMKLKIAITLKETNTKWIGTLVIAIMILVLGLLLLFNPFAGVEITKLAGAFLVAMAVFDIIDVYIIQK